MTGSFPSMRPLRLTLALRTALSLALCAGPMLLCAPSVQAAGRLDEQLQQLLAPLSGADRLRLAGCDLRETAQLRRFYEERGFAPVWTADRGQRQRVKQLLRALEDAALHGLEPDRYHADAISKALNDRTWSRAELLASNAFLHHARHRINGSLNPAEVDPSWHIRHRTIDPVPYLEAVASGQPPDDVLDQLWPDAQLYRELVQAKRRFAAETVDYPQIIIGPGPVLTRGMRDPRVPRLRQRLSVPGSSDRYDDPLVDAVMAFQGRAGVAADGLVGEQTLTQLNRTPGERLRQIDANLERWRWLPAELPPRFILVNPAAFRLTAVNEGQTVLELPVIVGKPDRPTPTLRENLQYLVFNPYWDVPESIAVRDKLPELREDPSRLAAQGLEAAPVGSSEPARAMVPVDQIRWHDVPEEPFPYRLRQRPGPTNPLGRLKFMLPNADEIYLHDTPDVGLFEKCQRSFSSGCVRVADVLRLAEWVLQFQHEPWDRASIENQLTSSETRTVTLDMPVPVFIVYFTSYVDERGTLRFQPDLYDRDAVIINALHGAAL